MKKARDFVRTPVGIRASTTGLIAESTSSLGNALRRAKANLFWRRLVYLVLGLFLLISLVIFAAGGYFGKLVQYLIDRAM